MRPGRALITTTRLPMKTASSMSWVTKSTVLRCCLPDAEQQLLHQLARLVVERAEGLVHQQHARVVGQRARDRGALLHAARQLLRVVLVEALQAHLGQEAVRDLQLLRARQAALAQAEADVVQHRQPGEQRVALEHHAAVGAGAVDALAVEQHLAGGRVVQPGDDAQQRALAAAAGAEDGDEVVLGHVQVGGLQRQRRCRSGARRRAR